VVFFREGFAPSDLVKAQKAGSTSDIFFFDHNLILNIYFLVYFLKDSPDFINFRGQTINAAHQVDALGQAQSMVYLGIFIIQSFNVFAVKARLTYPFGRRAVSNPYTFLGIFVGACLGMFIVYTPPLHVVFGGSLHTSPLYWLIPMAFGCVLLAWASLRIVFLRKSIEHKKVKDIKGLMMCTWYLLYSMTYPLIFNVFIVPTVRTKQDGEVRIKAIG
jgi:sodium/potassium-transporting ATPase subunit alpha